MPEREPVGLFEITIGVTLGVLIAEIIKWAFAIAMLKYGIERISMDLPNLSAARADNQVSADVLKNTMPRYVEEAIAPKKIDECMTNRNATVTEETARCLSGWHQQVKIDPDGSRHVMKIWK